MRRTRLALTLAALALGLLLPGASPAPRADAIEVSARPITRFDPRNPEATRFGALTFRGGLVLSARDPDFGGFSGLWLDPTGERLLAVSDRGHWLSATLSYDGAAPAALSGARLAPVLGPGGKAVPKTRRADVEALAVGNGTAVIGIEGAQEILQFRLPAGQSPSEALPALSGRPVPLPPAARRLPRNQSFEAIALPAAGPLKGATVAVLERDLDANGDNRAWILGRGAAQSFAVKRDGSGFDPTDLAVLPDGDLLLLERAFAWTSGFEARLRRLPAGAVKAGAVVDGPVIWQASFAQEIDNLEALAVHTAADGAVVVTLMSDDNFHPLERTLLLQFTLGPAD